ncbi:hypothetical protein [Actinacidiphila alni]|uniref:hypothetical protein n=1 Tax=Actinacidiphila alni TaxID=380248 RepID=UPI003456FA88
MLAEDPERGPVRSLEKGAYAVAVRHLTEALAVATLRRGSTIEQFLGGTGAPEKPAIRWTEIVPRAEGCAVVVHDVEDIGGENFCDLVAFPAVENDDGEESFGRVIGVADDGPSALALAEERLGAHRSRWVNQGVAGDEYRDYVRAARAAWPPPGESAS